MRVLFIAYHFPPDAAIGAVRPYQFSRLLLDYGIESWIITVEPGFAEARDDSFKVEGIPEERIVRTRVRKTMRRGLVERLSTVRTGVRSALGPGAAGSMARAGSIADVGWLQSNLFRRRVDSWLSYPDRLAGWYRPAVDAADALLRRTSFDAVISTSPPRIAHLIAHNLVRRHRLPWIMDLRDPWYDKWTEGAHESKVVVNMQRRLFERCAKQADKILVNTERSCVALSNDWPGLAKKIQALPNGCNVESMARNGAEPYAGFSISHYGNIYQQRSGGVFLQGLRRLLDDLGPDAVPVQARFRGHELGNTEDLVRSLGLAANVDLCPPVSRNSIPAMMGSDYVLLLIANDQPLQVPGKLYEYLAAGRRILAIAEHDSATADILRGVPGCVTAQSPEEVRDALASFSTDYRLGRSAEVDYRALINEYSYSRQTGKLARALAEATSAA